MPLERFVIEELGGLNRNLVDGLGQQPDELKNLKFDRMGGWRHYGLPEAERSGLPDPLYQSINRYGVYFDDTIGVKEYHLHDVVANGIRESSLDKDATLWLTGENIFNADGSTEYFVIPGVRYGPWIDTPTGLNLSPDQLAVDTRPEVTVTWTNGEGDLAHTTNYYVGYAYYVYTRGGKYVYATELEVIEPALIGASAAGKLTITVGQQAGVIYPSVYRDTFGADVYISTSPFLGSGALVNPSAPFGYLGGGTFNTVLEYKVFLTDLVPTSEIFVEGRADLTVKHQGRYYYVHAIPLAYDQSPVSSSFYGFGYEVNVGPVWDILEYGYGPDNIVVYSEAVPGNFAVNAVRATNFFTVNPEAGAGINALMSSPAGLLVFCENEIFLFRGDPASSPSLVRYSGTIGNTPGAHPVSLAGVIFNVWGGHVYMHSLGMGDVDFGQGIARISDAVYLLGDPFVNVYADQENNQIIAETENGLLYVYDSASQSWFEHEYSGDGYTPLNYGGGPLVDGNLFYASTGVISFIKNEGAAPSGSPPGFTFSHLDFGDKRAQKLFRSVEVFTNPGWSSTAAPTLTYQVGEAPTSTTVTGEDLGSGRWVFRMEPGASGPRGSFEFSFPLMAAGDVIEPPIVFNYVPKGRRRI